MEESERHIELEKPNIKAFVEAVFSDSVANLNEVLTTHSFSVEELNGSWFHFGAPAVVQAKSNLAMVDRLIEAGADINQKSDWWAGGFGVLDNTGRQLADELICRGAQLEVWSAAELCKLEELQAMLAKDSQLLAARGPDGKTPLHCAGNIEVAEYLVSLGADLNAKCVDHESTAAQYMISDHPEIVRFLIDQGCTTDIMMAAALGDCELAERILNADESVLCWEISRDFFPSSAADCIYSWTLGWYLTPHQVAHSKRHSEILELFLSRSDTATRFLNACLLQLDRELQQIHASSPDPVSGLSAAQRQHVAHSARNNETEAVRRLLDAGFSPDERSQHGATVLQWSLFHGNREMSAAALAYSASLTVEDTDFQSTPLGWLRQGAMHGWYKDSGDYLGCLQLLVQQDSNIVRAWKPLGHPQIDQWVEASSNT
ncbi:MAG: ankyrin repeat domain-containing protein [Planctomycetota bacterium]